MENSEKIEMYSGEKTDCFAYGKFKNGCSVLTELYCKNEICKFYKTKKQFEEGKKRK